MAYLPRTVRVAFMALSCSKCDDMSVANTISTTRVRKSLKKSFITLIWKSEVDRYGIRQVKYGVWDISTLYPSSEVLLSAFRMSVAIRRKENTASQWESKLGTRKPRKARENEATKSWLLLGFHLIGWGSDTSRVSAPITEQNKARSMQSKILSTLRRKLL